MPTSTEKSATKLLLTDKSVGVAKLLGYKRPPDSVHFELPVPAPSSLTQDQIEVDSVHLRIWPSAQPWSKLRVSEEPPASSRPELFDVEPVPSAAPKMSMSSSIDPAPLVKLKASPAMIVARVKPLAESLPISNWPLVTVEASSPVPPLATGRMPVTSAAKEMLVSKMANSELEIVAPP